VTPRFAWAPPRARSLGPDCVAFWRAAGGELYEWQELAIDQILGVGEDGLWASSTDGLDVARQNGKGVVLQAVEAFCAFELDYPVVMHTAHEFATSVEHQLRLETMIQNAPDLHARVRDRGGYVHANGQESIRLKSGSRIVFKARTKGGGRGYSGDLLVWDEAMVLPDAVVGAQLPMTRASKAPYGRKTIYAGSAVDQLIHEHGVNFARLRERGIAKAPKMSWLEFSAPFDNPDDLTSEQLADRELWRLANPSMEAGLVSEDTMADELAEMSPRTFAVELLGVGDWPVTDGSQQTVIDLDVWDKLEDAGSEIVGQLAFAFDVSVDRSAAAIGVAGRTLDGQVHVELVEHREGTKWLLPRLVELNQRHSPRAVYASGAPVVGTLVDELKLAAVPAVSLNGTEYGQACASLVDAVNERDLRHLGQPKVRAAIRGAATRDLDGTQVWSRKSSSVDISPLVAVTLAHWGVATAPSGSYTLDVAGLFA
jgi:hypothetical protein